jgi:putative hemolysin
MSSTLGIEVSVILLLILANGFFAAAEISIVSARRSRLQHDADAGKRGAKQAIELADSPDRFLAIVQVGITLISTFAAAFGGASISEPLAHWLSLFPLLQPYASTIALGTVVVLITYFSLVVGELVPKRLALQSAESIALFTAPIMTALAVVLRPAVAVLTFSVGVILRLIGRNTATQTPVTEEDIVYLAREGMVSGTVETGESELIRRVFRFTDRRVNAVMTPRTDIVAVALGTPLTGVIETFRTSGYSRLPLYQRSLDNILGVLYAKDLLGVGTAEEMVDLIALARPASFVPEYRHADDLLTTFRREGIHMAMVVDEYSQVVGLVTLEDLLEELVGEIQDEYDTREDTEEPTFVKRADGSWLVDAMVPYETVWERLHLSPLPEDHPDYTTLAGFLLSQLERIPSVGDTVTLPDATFEVVDMDGRRIDKVLIRPVQRVTDDQR